MYDVVIVSETWLVNQSSYATNPLYLCQSKLPSQLRDTGHQNGGLLILCHPALIPSIKVRSTSEFACSFSIENTTLSAVYFPPKLSDQEILTELNNLPPTDMLFGDINVRLGVLSGDTTTTVPSRRETIATWSHSNHLGYVRNSNDQISRTDHVYSKIVLDWKYSWQVPFNTDHGIMSLSIPIRKRETAAPVNKRYDFKPFYNALFSLYFASYYDYYHGPLLLRESLQCMDQCLFSMILPSTKDTQLLIDVFYDGLTDSIHAAMEANLVMYDANLVKTRQDHSVILTENSSNTSIMRSFKRSQRNHHANHPLVTSDPSLSPLEECQNHYGKLYHSEETPPAIQRANDIAFADNVTSFSISECIRKYPNAKSMGKDNIHTLVLKSLIHSDYFLPAITNFYKVCAATGLVPSQWSDCRLHLLLKDPENRIASKTRPIVLSPILRRIFEKVLMRVWSTNPEPWMNLHPSQAGFRRGFNCHSQLILSDEISRRDNPLSIFLDFSSAFDNVNWLKLESLLCNLQCPLAHKSLILSLICKPADLHLSVNHSPSIVLQTRKGVFQGGGISAFIFAVYINPLAIQLNELAPPHRPHGLLFADDVQLKPTDVTHAQRLLDLCSIYALEYGMSWNINKCAVLGSTHPFHLSGKLLPSDTTYKYLGMCHRAKGVDWMSTLTKAINTQRSFLLAIADNPWPAKARLTIVRSFVRPITDYCTALVSIWADQEPTRSKQVLDLLLKNHKLIHCFIFRTGKFNAVMEFLTGLGPVEHYIETLRAGLARFLHSLDQDNPLRYARKTYCLSTSKHFILPFCWKSTYYTLFKSSLTGILKSFRTWKTLKFEKIHSEKSSKSLLISYIQPKERARDNSSLLLRQPQQVVRKGLAWRSNVSFLGKLCPAHNGPFHRTHLGCVLSSHPSYQSTLSSDSFQLVRDKLPPDRTYTVFDHLLNIGDFSLFFKLYCQVESNLTSTQQTI